MLIDERATWMNSLWCGSSWPRTGLSPHGAGVGHALASGDLYNGRKTVLVADPRKWKPLRRFCGAFVHGSERRM